MSGATGAMMEDTLPLVAFFRDSAGDPISDPRPSVRWTSSNPTVVQIVSDSLAVALDTGVAVLVGVSSTMISDTLEVPFRVIPRWYGRLVWDRAPAAEIQTGIAVRDLPSQSIRQLPDLGYPGAGSGDPYLSSDGRYLLAISTRPSSPVSRRTIYLVDMNTGTKSAPFDTLPGNQFAPVWWPGDTTIAFLTEAATGYEVFTARPDGSSRLQRTVLHQAVPPFFDVTPEGTLILELRETRNPNGNNPTDLVEIALTGDTLRQLTNDPGYETSAAVSPDGMKVAYEKDGQVWLRNRDGSNPYQLLPEITTLSGFSPRFVANSSSPSWSPDGKFVLLAWHIDPTLRHDGQAYEVLGEIYAVRIEDGLAIRLTKSPWADTSPFFR
jgi:hypothetical protein